LLFDQAITTKAAVRKLVSVTMSLLLKSAALVLSALALGTILFGRLHVDAEAPAPLFDLLITNARMVDGGGNPLFRADVALEARNQSGHADEVRALWVVRTTLTSPEKIRALVDSAADNGFNTLIVQIRGRGDAYYNSKVEPRAVELKDQPPTFDPLALTLSEAHKRGLKVHGWLNTNLLANLDALPGDPRHVYNKHPEWLAVPKPVAAGLYRMSPRDPAYRETSELNPDGAYLERIRRAVF